MRQLRQLPLLSPVFLWYLSHFSWKKLDQSFKIDIFFSDICHTFLPGNLDQSFKNDIFPLISVTLFFAEIGNRVSKVIFPLIFVTLFFKEIRIRVSKMVFSSDICCNFLQGNWDQNFKNYIFLWYMLHFFHWSLDQSFKN